MNSTFCSAADPVRDQQQQSLRLLQREGVRAVNRQAEAQPGPHLARAALRAVVVGGLCGALVGALLKSLTSSTAPGASIELRAIAVALLAAGAVSIGFFGFDRLREIDGAPDE
jgi:hypothetical protein